MPKWTTNPVNLTPNQHAKIVVLLEQFRRGLMIWDEFLIQVTLISMEP